MPLKPADVVVALQLCPTPDTPYRELNEAVGISAGQQDSNIAMTTSGIVLCELPALTPTLLDPATNLCVTPRSRVSFEFANVLLCLKRGFLTFN